MTELDLAEQNAPAEVDDEDDSDEVAAVQNGERTVVDVRRAVDPPARVLTIEDIVGRWDLPKRKVILPTWIRSWTALRGVVWWLTRWTAYQATFHATRSPKYVGRAVVRTLVGSWRVVVMFLGWLLDREGRQMARAAHEGTDQSAWRGARKEWRDTVHRRLIITATYLVGMAAVLVAAVLYLPAQGAALVVVALAGVLVHLGAPEDAPLFDVPMDHGTKLLRLTSGMVLKALNGLGIDAIRQVLKDDPKGVKFHEPPQRDSDAGFSCAVVLPPGVTAGEVMERREKLASGLRRPLGCVWPEAVPGEHPGLLALFVADEDMNSASQQPWPLRRSGTVDLFKQQPFGTDQRGRLVNISLMYASGVIGAVPRVGKTFSLRLILLIAALDVRAKIYAFDKKGSGDLSPLEHVAHAYTVGDDPEDIAVDLQYLRDLQKEMRRRYKVIRGLPKDVAPETKVTPELAGRRDLGLEPVVMGVDEVQMWFEHEDKKTRDEFISICTDLVKRGPAAGIMCIFATQRPDAKSIPTAISNNAVLRFCLKVMEWGANDQVLGTGMHKAGVKATVFDFADKGIGYLLSEGVKAQIVKTFYIDAAAAERVAQRARLARERADRLTGYCIGDQINAPESESLIEDLPRVFVQSERLHSDDIVEQLQSIRVGTYAGWTKTTFAHAARDQLGLSPKQLRVGEKVSSGLTRDMVTTAVGDALNGRALPSSGGDSAARGS